MQNNRKFIRIKPVSHSSGGRPGSTGGMLAYIEIEALADGKPVITFQRDVLNVISADGKNFAVKLFE